MARSTLMHHAHSTLHSAHNAGVLCLLLLFSPASPGSRPRPEPPPPSNSQRRRRRSSRSSAWPPRTDCERPSAQRRDCTGRRGRRRHWPARPRPSRPGPLPGTTSLCRHYHPPPPPRQHFPRALALPLACCGGCLCPWPRGQTARRPGGGGGNVRVVRMWFL